MIKALPGERTLHRGAEVVGSAVGLNVADLHMGLVERRVLGHPHKKAAPGILNQAVIKVSNGSCVRRLGFRSMGAARARNAVAALAIALTTVLFTDSRWPRPPG